jgi:hypothetical protein
MSILWWRKIHGLAQQMKHLYKQYILSYSNDMNSILYKNQRQYSLIYPLIQPVGIAKSYPVWQEKPNVYSTNSTSKQNILLVSRK